MFGSKFGSPAIFLDAFGSRSSMFDSKCGSYTVFLHRFRSESLILIANLTFTYINMGMRLEMRQKCSPVDSLVRTWRQRTKIDKSFNDDIVLSKEANPSPDREDWYCS